MHCSGDSDLNFLHMYMYKGCSQHHTTCRLFNICHISCPDLCSGLTGLGLRVVFWTFVENYFGSPCRASQWILRSPCNEACPSILGCAFAALTLFTNQVPSWSRSRKALVDHGIFFSTLTDVGCRRCEIRCCITTNGQPLMDDNTTATLQNRSQNWYVCCWEWS